MTEYVVVGGMLTPVEESAAVPFGYGKIYAKFTVTHPTDGSLTFYWGDIGFAPDGTSASPWVYAVVISWDKFTKYMSEDGQSRDGSVQLQVAGAATCVPSNSIKRYQIAALLQECNLFDVPIEFYQWNERDNSQKRIWQGFIVGAPQTEYPGGVMVVTFEMSSMQTALFRPISPIVNKTSYPQAPQDAIGKMIPKWYGNIITGMDSGAEVQEAVYLDYGSRFVEGVITAENLTTLKAQFDFHQNDGVKSCAKIDTGLPNDPSEPTACWIYTGGAFCMVDAVDLAMTNDVNGVSAQFPIEPKVWTPIHPSGVGANMHAGFVATAYKGTNDDPNDFLETTPTDYEIAYNIPPLSLPGFVCTEVIVMVDVWADPTVPLDARTFDWGLWNIAKFNVPGYFGTGGAGGIAGASGRVSINIGIGGDARSRYYMSQGGPPVKQYYLPRDAKDNLGSNTLAEFGQGHLVGRDSSDALVPLQLFFSVSSTARDKVRFYGGAVILHGRLTVQKTRRATGKPIRHVSDIDFFQKPFNRVETKDVIGEGALGQYKVLLAGWGQKDHGTVYNGTTVDAPIERGSAIAHHLLADRGGLACNTASGSLGNFPDALTEEVAGEKFIAPIWGSDESVDFDRAKDALQAHHQIELHREDDGYHIFYDEMNPHASRRYRSASDPVYIEGWDIEEGSFKVSMPGLDELSNVVQLRYGHVYGSNRPLGSVQYSNPLSVDLYDARPVETFNEPWITAKDLSAAAPEAANFRARYLGRKHARRLLTVYCSLGQSFSSLKRGNVIEFGKSMEDYGYICQAHRCGLTNYAYISDSDTTNYKDSAAPKYVKASGDGASYWMVDQQIDELLASVATPAGFTLSAWQYYSGPSVYDAASWTPFSDVLNPNGLKSAGAQRISWSRPVSSSWRKSELPLAGTTKGPGYPLRMLYTAATAQGLGNGVTGYTRRFWGRSFVVREATRRPGRYGDYPKMDVELREVL